MNAVAVRTGRPSLAGAPLAVVACLIGCWLLFPRAAPGDSPASAFRGEHARAQLARFASEPRPMGSEAHERAFGTLLRELGRSGARPMPQANESLRNVLARVDGSDPTGTVLFVAHYDSREDTPGAADDGLAVVALLQVIELLASGPAPRNDLAFLFTDGEEAGLLGARLFVEHSPDLADVSLVLNFDAIGNHGPLVLFQTGPRSGGLVAAYGKAVPHPVATSLAPYVYALLPNDTDFTPFLEVGLRGLNFAVVGGGSAYHAPFDTAANVAPATVQLVGETMLALARTLGRADLAELPEDERVFFDVVALGVVSYGPLLGRILVALSLVLLLACVSRIAREQGLGPRDVARSLLDWGALSLASALLLWTVWFVLSRVGPLTTSVAGEAVRPTGNHASTLVTLAGVGLLALVLVAATIEHLRRDAHGTERLARHLAGGLVAWIVVVSGLSVLGPFVLAQAPLAVCSVAVGLLLARSVPAALPLGGTVAVLLLAPHLALTFLLLSKNPPKAVLVLALALSFGAGLFGPWLAAHPTGRRRTIAAGVVGAALVVLGGRMAFLGS